MEKEYNIITIEKNIPCPSSSWGRCIIKYAFMKNMEVNDSFYINGNTPDFTPVSVRSYVYGLNAKSENSGKKYTVRTISGNSNNPNGIRVWRIQ